MLKRDVKLQLTMANKSTNQLFMKKALRQNIPKFAFGQFSRTADGKTENDESLTFNGEFGL